MTSEQRKRVARLFQAEIARQCGAISAWNNRVVAMKDRPGNETCSRIVATDEQYNHPDAALKAMSKQMEAQFVAADS